MIIIPTGTDAPIYHWPFATVGLIVLNVALLFLVPPVAGAVRFDENDEVIEDAESVSNFERYALAIGDGRLHPVQWVTHNFLHYGFLHLAGNMLFLWAFGIVVEGKLGPLKFLLAYLAIGTLHGALVQILLRNSGLDNNAAGASAVIYGLLAVCMIWAPRNELNCLLIIIAGFRTFVRELDLYYTTVALLYIGEQLFGLVFWGSVEGRIMVSEMGHLSGAFWGTLVALVMLKAGLVDCEGWDVFSLWAKRKALAKKWEERARQLEQDKLVLRSSVKALVRAKSSRVDEIYDADQPSRQERAAAAVRRVQSLIDDRDVPGALAMYDKTKRTLFDWPAQPDLYAMIKALHAQGALVDSIRLMRDHCRSYPGASSKMGVKLAQVLLRDCQRPVAALRVLEEIPAGSLPADLEKARRRLVQQAEAMRAEGVLELEGDD
jgi:membrane associated rhomboid family serine protease